MLLCSLKWFLGYYESPHSFVRACPVPCENLLGENTTRKGRVMGGIYSPPLLPFSSTEAGEVNYPSMNGGACKSPNRSMASRPEIKSKPWFQKATSKGHIWHVCR